LANGSVGSQPDGGEDSRAEGGAFADVNGDDGRVVHVGLELSPELRASPPTGSANLSNRDLHFAEDGDLLAHAEGDAFEGCAEHVGAGMSRGEAVEGAAGVGV